MPEPSPAIRRNGLLQSCEPCRKSKLKCDHGRPVCGRCSLKNITQRCYYHPAPMTKQDTLAQRPPAKRARTEPSNSNEVSSMPISVPQFALGVTERPSTTPGYLGSTSFSAVFTEHRTEISFEESSCVAEGVFATLDDRFRLESGLEVLKFLYRSNVCDILIRRFYAGHIMAAISPLIIEAIMHSIRRIFDGFDRSQDLEKQLQDLVLRVFRSTAYSLTSHSLMTVEEYFASFTDGKLRWEAIGMMLATAGIALMSTADSDPDLMRVAPDAQAKDTLRTQVMEASGICLGFCDSAASINELRAFHQHSDLLLRTQYWGDTSYAAWRRLGDLTSTIYAAGLHQESTRSQNCPPFLQQWRRVCFSTAFDADKSISTFVGRPPFIHYRYSTNSPPLDVSDEVLIAGGERLDQEMSNLDAAGWNTQGNTFRGSMLRLRFLLAVLREQALEVALETFDDSDLILKYNKVIEAAHSLWESCPVNLRHDRDNKSEDTTVSSSLCFGRRHIYLGYLFSLFLVQRTVVKRTNTGHQTLFETSRKILAIILELTGERHPGIDVSRHHSWITLYYGLPAASILAFELLRQTREAGPHPVLPPRPELIRNLSVFVSCLSWVAAPGQGNYRTCKIVEKKLSDILDQILDPQPIQRDFVDGDHNGLYGLLNWYSPENFEFDPFDFQSKDAFPF
ncbi:putative C6 transcription factor [Aspergillus undulatus]|uniref:putative C6 transcription factor n=1 Tax=Aspergillus undulatus TaxID=1810928 RepID=UPI003CCDF40B